MAIVAETRVIAQEFMWARSQNGRIGQNRSHCCSHPTTFRLTILYPVFPMFKTFSRIACAAVVGAVVTTAFAGSAQAFSFNVTTGKAALNGATNQGAFSDFNGQPGFMNIDFNGGSAPTTGFAQYSFQNGTKSSVRADQWAPTSLTGERNKSKYLAVFNGDKVNIKLDSKFNYYGINWGAISANNTFSFYKGNQLIKSIKTQDINPLATVTAAHQNGEKNAYVHFYADNASEVFDRIEIEQSSTSGGGFESDNHSFSRGSNGFAKTPEPASMLGLAAVTGAAAWMKRKRSA
jgi:hypothetical protein